MYDSSRDTDYYLCPDLKETIMIRRPGLLAVLAITLAPLQSFAQFGGMGGMGVPMSPEEVRTVQVEMDGGQSIRGKLRLGSVTIDTSVGQYQIKPEKVKIIRLSGSEDKPGDEAGAVPRFRGVVITTSDKEIHGIVSIPTWTLAIDVGTLTLVPAKLKTITFTADSEKKTPVTPDAGGPGGKAGALRSSESKESPLKVDFIDAPGVVGLSLRGPKMTRVAAASSLNGVWHPQDLREPVEGQALPIVGPGVVVYGLGRYVYAFGSESHAWGVLELPEGVQASPTVGPGSVTVEHDGHTYTFNTKTGKWDHFDIRALLDIVEGKDKGNAGSKN